MKASALTLSFSEPLPAPFEPSADQLPARVSHLVIQSAALSTTPLLFTFSKLPPTYRSVQLTARTSTLGGSEPLPAPFETSADQFPVRVSHSATQSAAPYSPPLLFTFSKSPPA